MDLLPGWILHRPLLIIEVASDLSIEDTIELESVKATASDGSVSMFRHE